ncbi:hypothetical protein MUP77_14590 [Candidatus Bathyarchaeota archaeon]|nr:hypothetical protein [Candidatus Bathyarchaeota archaeon]
MAEKDSKKASEEKKQPSKDVKAAPKEQEKKAEPINPYKQGSKQFLVAKALMSGELDRGKMARELGVSVNTIHNVTGELAGMGYTIAIQQNKRRVNYSTGGATGTGTATGTATGLTHGEGQKQGSESGKESGSLSNQGGNGSESEQVVSEKDLTQSGKSSTEGERTYSEADVRREIGRAVGCCLGWKRLR